MLCRGRSMTSVRYTSLSPPAAAAAAAAPIDAFGYLADALTV